MATGFNYFVASLRKISLNKSSLIMGESISKSEVNQRSVVARPAIANSVGYTVEVKSTLLKMQKGSYFVGVVCGVDLDTGIIRVRFKEYGEQKGDDIEHIPYVSSDILWMAEPIKAISRSSVDLPTIESSIGYKVEVKSTLPDAEEGDFFAGSVTGFDLAKMTIFITFESEQNEEPDIEEIFYNSPDIAWICKPTLPSIKEDEAKEDEDIKLTENINTTMDNTVEFSSYKSETDPPNPVVNVKEILKSEEILKNKRSFFASILSDDDDHSSLSSESVSKLNGYKFSSGDKKDKKYDDKKTITNYIEDPGMKQCLDREETDDSMVHDLVLAPSKSCSPDFHTERIEPFDHKSDSSTVYSRSSSRNRRLFYNNKKKVETDSSSNDEDENMTSKPLFDFGEDDCFIYDVL